jgi:hypothetical protein
MDSKQKVQDLVRALAEVVINHLRTRPDGVSSRQLREDLGLEESFRGGRKSYILWGILNLLRTEGKVRIDKTRRPHRILLSLTE